MIIKYLCMLMNISKFNLPQKFISYLHSRLSARQFLIFSSILVGISAGLAAVILKTFVHVIRKYIVEYLFTNSDYKYLFLLLPVLGIGLTILTIRYLLNGKLSRGTVNILHSIAKKSSFLPFQQMYSHILTSGLTVGFGGSAGLESPIVTTGAALGSNYSKRYRLSYKERTLLLAAGAAGGIAGAFNAPIAGVLFALEVILVDISITAFIPLLIAAASGALVSRIILDENILLNFRLKAPFDYHNVPFYIILGLLSGAVSLYYVNISSLLEEKFKRIRSKAYKWLIGSVLLILLFALFPSLFGEGYESIKSLSELDSLPLIQNSIIASHVRTPLGIFFFISCAMLIKAIATSVTINSGGNGGNFAPSLFVGAYLGFSFSGLLQLMGFNDIPVSNFTIVAMAGILSGVFHAPLTAIFLIAEITGGYELMIPLMIVSSSSYILVKYFHPHSIDVRKLMRKGTIVSENRDISILGKINVLTLIEHDFSILEPDDKLRSVIETIKHSRRNIFPVVNKNRKLLGVIQLDHIKEEMFNPELYDKITARELMLEATTKISISEDIFSIMKKFDESGYWNLPVTENGMYVGFLSKSSILTKYRNELLATF